MYKGLVVALEQLPRLRVEGEVRALLIESVNTGKQCLVQVNGVLMRS